MSMNREIEFRALTNTTKGKKWVYGYPYKVKSLFDETNFNWYIRNEHILDIIVDKNTLGQYTGLKDKNGKKIFEGDIVKVHFTYEDLMEEYEKDVDIQGVVSLTTALGIYIDTGDDMENYLSEYLNDKNLLEYPEHIEVIGNIYENNLESQV